MSGHLHQTDKVHMSVFCFFFPWTETNAIMSRTATDPTPLGGPNHTSLPAPSPRKASTWTLVSQIKLERPLPLLSSLLRISVFPALPLQPILQASGEASVSVALSPLVPWRQRPILQDWPYMALFNRKQEPHLSQGINFFTYLNSS